MCGFIRVTELLSVLYVLHFIQPGAPSWPTVPVLWLVSWPQPGPLIGWPDPGLAHSGHSSEYQSTYFQLQPHRTSPASFIHKINYILNTGFWVSGHQLDPQLFGFPLTHRRQQVWTSWLLMYLEDSWAPEHFSRKSQWSDTKWMIFWCSVSTNKF